MTVGILLTISSSRYATLILNISKHFAESWFFHCELTVMQSERLHRVYIYFIFSARSLKGVLQSKANKQIREETQ